MAKESAKKAMEPYDWGVKAALQRMGEDSNPYNQAPMTTSIGWLGSKTLLTTATFSRTSVSQ